MEALDVWEDGDVTATRQQQSEWQQYEGDEVFAWRHSQLVRSGFPEPLAARIAHDGRFDLHQLLELVERGCPPEIAFRILAPLEDDPATLEEDLVAN
ncbi:MAG TPA: hypothetical protein VJ838_14785 [Gaiellaceae bacterium]|jgi:hypothetical protein|nr:hypothetical protein [Gaiellaceae bacterium]